MTYSRSFPRSKKVLSLQNRLKALVSEHDGEALVIGNSWRMCCVFFTGMIKNPPEEGQYKTTSLSQRRFVCSG